MELNHSPATSTNEANSPWITKSKQLLNTITKSINSVMKSDEADKRNEPLDPAPLEGPTCPNCQSEHIDTADPYNITPKEHTCSCYCHSRHNKIALEDESNEAPVARSSSYPVPPLPLHSISSPQTHSYSTPSSPNFLSGYKSGASSLYPSAANSAATSRDTSRQTTPRSSQADQLPYVPGRLIPPDSSIDTIDEKEYVIVESSDPRRLMSGEEGRDGTITNSFASIQYPPQYNPTNTNLPSTYSMPPSTPSSFTSTPPFSSHPSVPPPSEYWRQQALKLKALGEAGVDFTPHARDDFERVDLDPRSPKPIDLSKYETMIPPSSSHQRTQSKPTSPRELRPDFSDLDPSAMDLNYARNRTRTN